MSYEVEKGHVGILAVRVICHYLSGKSRGYGFLRFASEAPAIAALEETHSWCVRILNGIDPLHPMVIILHCEKKRKKI